MDITAFHAKYFAHDLTRRCASDSVEKLASVLSDAQVDLNPHQIEAALFAFRNPFSRGAILADEVGLGKTIEAGLLLAQKWAERKRRLLVIVPANLRKQWSQELADKFHLPSAILENRNFNDTIRAGNLNPFQQDSIVLCSYQFARKKEPYLQQTPWDLVVIDEAHRLRNVYKLSSKIANAIKQAVAPFPKVLLTATPLQNSLLELYGLVSIIDDYAFGDFKTYRSRFTRLGNDADFNELKERLKPLCKRTLRKQVLEYVKYTNRHALVQEFVPTREEQRLYDLVSAYLQQPTLYALPASQRQLMTLILRKLLASSTYAISDTLAGLARKLETAAVQAEAVDAPPEELAENLEELEELADEWDEDENNETSAAHARLSPEQLAELRREMAQLRDFHVLAKSIIRNSKGEVLLTALRRGFVAATEAQKNQGTATLQQKAVIFTESRRTQEYLFRILEQTEFAGKVMIFNGTNTDPKSKEIYRRWLEKHAGTDHISGSPSADMRAVAAVRQMEKIEPAKIRVSAGQIGVTKGGVTTTAMSVAEEQVSLGSRPVPDLLAYLQNETELTRSTLVRILTESHRLAEFFVDPQRFMDVVAAILKYELHRLLVDGIKYERLPGTGPEAEWEMVLFKNEELINYLTALQVQKSVYEYVVYDSEVEREFARRLDQREDIKLFVKLPSWFEIDTPVGKYNPDWAILKQDDRTLYLVRETKATRDFLKLRTSEADKVRCGQRHFEALGVPFAVAVSADEV
jgi:hypothetical protein